MPLPSVPILTMPLPLVPILTLPLPPWVIPPPLVTGTAAVPSTNKAAAIGTAVPMSISLPSVPIFTVTMSMPNRRTVTKTMSMPNRRMVTKTMSMPNRRMTVPMTPAITDGDQHLLLQPTKSRSACDLNLFSINTLISNSTSYNTLLYHVKTGD